MSVDEQVSGLTLAEVIEIVGKTEMHGETMQVERRIREGSNQGRVTTRNVLGLIREGDIFQLRETQYNADSIGGQ